MPKVSVVWLVLGLLCVFQWTDAGKLGSKCKERKPKDCHFIIVGAGAAGSVLAYRLSEDHKVNVCIFEAGTKDTGQPLSHIAEVPRLSNAASRGAFSWNYTTTPQSGLNGRELFTGMGKVLGGSTTHNGMAYFRGFKADYDYWASKGATGWSYKDVLPFFLKSENNISPLLKDSVLHNKCGPLTISQDIEATKTPVFKLLSKAAREDNLREADCSEASPFGICHMQLTINSGKRESTSTAFLQPVAGRKNLFISTESFVEKILISRKSKRAYGIRYIKNGKVYNVSAKREIIVSGGTLNSPKLLQRSGIGPRALLRKFRIRPHAILPVGESYHDHVIFTFDISLDVESVTFKRLMDQDVLAEYIFRRKGLYAWNGMIKSVFFDTKVQTFNWPEIQLQINEGLFSEINLRKDIEAGEFLKRDSETRNGTSLWFYLLHPKSRGTVKLRSLKPFDPPLINPEELNLKEDVREIIKGLRRFQRYLRTPSMVKAGASLEPSNPVPSVCKNEVPDSDKQWECIFRNLASAGLHMVSTCKMGSVRDPSVVVDPKLRVKGIKCLRVADASIMPEVPSTNTQGPAIMVGEKAADIIRSQYKH